MLAVTDGDATGSYVSVWSVFDVSPVAAIVGASVADAADFGASD